MPDAIKTIWKAPMNNYEPTNLKLKLQFLWKYNRAETKDKFHIILLLYDIHIILYDIRTKQIQNRDFSVWSNIDF